MNDDTDVGDLNPKCLCEISARHFTSWTDSNPGRHFWGFYNYRGYGNCRFFRWSDPPMCARLKVIIPGLLRRIRDFGMRSWETNGFEGNDTSVSPVVGNEEVSSRGGMRRNEKELVLSCGCSSKDCVICREKLLENM
ncbi:hypothetical protein Dsin_001017 [Dipteronia sinensis]|uniref:Zinc finger GRF-type domain-containing protein n=1 Tax=Dipteronia sinensis TaxID=43782 RepID=A0AAE0B327_9ROSI|nr:hypothetical protein Dsin_001017 [Dipteronia sinensis]